MMELLQRNQRIHLRLFNERVQEFRNIMMDNIDDVEKVMEVYEAIQK